MVPAQEIEKIATLARLQLSPQEQASIGRDLESILKYMAKLDELDTTDVTPTTLASHGESSPRSDSVVPSLPVETALGNAPEPLGAAFGVPKIIE